MDTFPQKKFRAHVLKTELVARGVKKITFQLSERFSFVPGQYIWIDLSTQHPDESHGGRHAFSILNNADSENTVEIVARLSDSSFKQRLFALVDGDTVELHGPFGSTFVLDPTRLPKQIVMIAGGLGISPFLSVLTLICAQRLPIRCFLVYLNRSKEQTPFLSQLASLKKQLPGFDYAVSYATFAWENVREQAESMGGDIQWWMAGPEPMMDPACAELASGGVSREQICFENYYPTRFAALTREVVQQQFRHDSVFTKALQTSANHTVITDPNGFVLFASKAAERITGYSQEEMFGQTPRLWGGLMSRAFYESMWKKILSGKPVVAELVNRRKNGEIYYTIAHISPIHDAEQRIVGFIGTEEDITVTKRQQRIIEDREQRLKYAIDANRDGLWDWNIATKEVYFSPRLKEMLGYQEHEMPGHIDEWVNRIHPDDRSAVDEDVQKLLQGVTPFYESKHRLLCKDGTYKWILDRGKIVERDPEGKPVRAIGTHTDISDIKEREEELHTLNRLMIGRELKMLELKERLKKCSSASS